MIVRIQGMRRNVLLIGLFRGTVGATLGLVGDPVAGISEGVHVCWVCGGYLGTDS